MQVYFGGQSMKLSKNYPNSPFRPTERNHLFVILWIIGLALVTVPLADAGRPSLYAVVVGVSKYRDPKIPKLQLSAKDAKDFAELLKRQSREFSDVKVKLLVNESATRDAVTDSLREGLRPAGKDDFVIIYLSGHGATHPTMPNEFYFLTYDARPGNLFGTALLMNDAKLFKSIDTDRVLMITDACNSGGFSDGFIKMRAKAAGKFLRLFNQLQGRSLVTSSKPDERSWENPLHENSVFTHYVLKGLRGSADKRLDGTITINELYDYVYDKTRLATDGMQHPQLYTAKNHDPTTPVFKIPSYDDTLKIDVQFKYLDDDNKVRRLGNGVTLKDGQRVGVFFRPHSDCFVHIFWWDSSGNLGTLYPNPKLTDGGGKVGAGRSCWLPKRGDESPEERWYVLDSNPGTETIYFVASRSKNEKLTKLCCQLMEIAGSKKSPERTETIEKEIGREINLMGFADYSVAKSANTGSSQQGNVLPAEMVDQIKVAGAEAIVRVQFRHIAK
jgi:Caspase domain/Domain of unknown function (DUF4384)